VRARFDCVSQFLAAVRARLPVAYSETTSWEKNSLVHFCPKFVNTTGSSPTITGGSCQTTMCI
jgi:hypothetical protein